MSRPDEELTEKEKEIVQSMIDYFDFVYTTGKSYGAEHGFPSQVLITACCATIARVLFDTPSHKDVKLSLEEISKVIFDFYEEISKHR